MHKPSDRTGWFGGKHAVAAADAVWVCQCTISSAPLTPGLGTTSMARRDTYEGDPAVLERYRADGLEEEAAGAKGNRLEVL